MANGQATARLSELIKNRQDAMRRIYRASAQETISIMQTPIGAGGQLRVDTGFLRASLQTALGNPNFTLQEKPPTPGRKPGDPPIFHPVEGELALVVNGADLNDTIVAAYTANYARPREYKDRWVALAAQRFPQVVNDIVRKENAAAAKRS